MKFGIVINGQILKNRNFTMKISDLDIETTIEEWEEEERYNEAMKNLSNIFQSKPKPVRRIKMPSRNDKCPCGSGKNIKLLYGH